jgi:hypothetical protein
VNGARQDTAAARALWVKNISIDSAVMLGQAILNFRVLLLTLYARTIQVHDIWGYTPQHIDSVVILSMLAFRSL